MTHGVNSYVAEKIGKSFFKALPDKSKKSVFDLCEILWQSGYLEEYILACNWSYYVHTAYVPEDIGIFKKWLDTYVNNWAACDTLCNHTIGEFLEMYPDNLVMLRDWAKSKNRWVRRGSAVSLIVPAKKGKFLKDVLEIADILLLDKDDMVQKGYGWMLKVASQAHLEEIFKYVLRKKSVMPRTALRYAIEKMPQDMKKEAMK